MGFRRTLALMTLTFSAHAFGYKYPEIDWKTFSTPHFVIHYYDEVEWTARKVAAVAEEVYPKITGIYGHEPAHRTHIVVRDDEDTSNGFAVFNLGWITIWTSPSTLSLRGRHDWIRGTLTHEFAHIVSLQASSGGGYRVEGVRFGGISNSDTSANTDVGGSVYFLTQPAYRWWAEGTAQLDTSIAGFNLWDSAQDMLLRAATLEDNLLTYDQLHNIDVREHFGGEMVYNQGYAFLLWLQEKYGPDANAKLAHTAEKQWKLDFSDQFEAAFNKPLSILYEEWRTELKAKYAKQIEEIRKEPSEGERIQLVTDKALSKRDMKDRPYVDGAYNFYPRFSPDGHWFSRIEKTTLYLRYLDSPFILPPPEDPKEQKKDKRKPHPLRLDFSASFYTWSPDSKRILISKRQSSVLGGYPYHDVFLLDLTEATQVRSDYLASLRKAESDDQAKKISKSYDGKIGRIDIDPKRISSRLRATHLAWSPDGNTVAFSENRDGHRNLRLMNPDGTNFRDLVAIGGDAEALDAAWSPDGQSIAFTLFNHDQSDIWIVPAGGGVPRALTLDANDDRNPTFTPDGKSIVFSSDRTGIFQLYVLPVQEMSKSEPIALSRLETGAFMPFVFPDSSELMYIRFSSFGFKPYRMGLKLPPLTEPTPVAPSNSPNDVAVKQLTPENDHPEPENPHSYRPWPRPVRFFPTAIWENEQFKAGVGLQVSDYLEKHSLTGLALFGNDQDYQVTYLNRMFYPNLSASYTSYVRSDPFAFVNDGDGINDDPIGIIRDNIQFVNAGVLQDLVFRHGMKGKHQFGISYDRRFVDRRIGFPVLINNEIETAFRLLTNDGMTVDWNYSHLPSNPGRDFDINPRDATYASVSYSLVHTSLFAADTSIPTPNQNYYYNEGTATFSQYFALPWEGPWWNQHTYWLRFTGGYKSRDVNINDEFFLGGRLNFRAFGQISSNTLFYGYEDFSIAGETMLLLSTGYTFPVVRAMDRKYGILYLDGIFASIFGEAGNAWDYGKTKNLAQNPTRDTTLDQGTILLGDIGAEIKIKAFLFNDFNSWNSIFRVAYGFQDDAAHGFSDSDNPLRFFIGIGTNF